MGMGAGNAPEVDSERPRKYPGRSCERTELASPLLFPSPPKTSKPRQDFSSGVGLPASLLATSAKDIEAELNLEYSNNALDTLSLPEAVFGLLNAMVGLSVLSLPYAFSLVGVSVGLPALLVVIAIMRHTGLLVGRSLRLAAKRPDLAAVPAKCRDFAFLARAGFGERGGSIVGIATGLEVWCALIAFMAFEAANSELLFPTVSRTASTVFNCILAAACAMLPMKVFTYVSLASSCAVLVMGVAVVTACTPTLMTDKLLSSSDEGTMSSSSGELLTGSFDHLSSLPRTIGIIIFCFAGHPCFPVMHECLRDKGDYARVVNVSFLLTLLYYCAFGCIGCIAFGHSVQQSVIQSLADLTGASGAFWQYIAAAAIFIKVQLTAPLLLNTILVALWPVPLTHGNFSLRRLVMRVSLLIALSLVTGVTALLFADDVGILASLTGNLLVMITSVLFPVYVFEKLSKENDDGGNTKQRILHGLVFALGCFMAVVGTVQAGRDLLHGRRVSS